MENYIMQIRSRSACFPLCSHTQKYRTCLSNHFRQMKIGTGYGSQNWPCGLQPEVTWRDPMDAFIVCAPKWAVTLYLSFINDKKFIGFYFEQRQGSQALITSCFKLDFFFLNFLKIYVLFNL